MSIVSVPDDVLERVRKFRFAKTSHLCALVLEINETALTLNAVREYGGAEVSPTEALEELVEDLPESSGRYLVISFCHEAGQRTTYPIILLHYSPPCCTPRSQMLYASALRQVSDLTGLDRICELRDSEDLTLNWLNNQAQSGRTRKD